MQQDLKNLLTTNQNKQKVMANLPHQQKAGLAFLADPQIQHLENPAKAEPQHSARQARTQMKLANLTSLAASMVGMIRRLLEMMPLTTASQEALERLADMASRQALLLAVAGLAAAAGGMGNQLGNRAVALGLERLLVDLEVAPGLASLQVADQRLARKRDWEGRKASKESECKLGRFVCSQLVRGFGKKSHV